MSTPKNGEDQAAVRSAEQPSTEEMQEAPVIVVTEVAGGGVEANGDAVRICVRTATQGLVTLHFEALVLAQLTELAVNLQNQAFRAAERAGAPPQRVYFNLQSFGIAEMADGILMHLNMNEQAERLYVLGEPNHAVSLGQALIKQAGIISAAKKGGLQKPVRKLILPGTSH